MTARLHTLVTSEDRAGPIAVGAEPLFVPEAVLSIGDADAPLPAWFAEVQVPKLRVLFDDVTRPHAWYVMATLADADAIVAFLQEHRKHRVLIHCAAGISRSSAAAYLRLLLNTQPGLVPGRLLRQVKIAQEAGLRDPVPVHPNPHLLRLGLASIAARFGMTDQWVEAVWEEFSQVWMPKPW